MRIGIYGYGNLGRGVEIALKKRSDLELVGIFTRRDPSSIRALYEESPIYSSERILEFKEKIDVLIVCGGSAKDLPEMTPFLAEHFNVIDSFDTHGRIPYHYANVDKSAKKGGKTALISMGWDPGLFSVARVVFGELLPNGDTFTFWGEGISQGHSEAIRNLEGVKDAREYTVPVYSIIDMVKRGKIKRISSSDAHKRKCYVVSEPNADKSKIESQIKNMPYYFSGYDTSVKFVSEEEIKNNHAGMPHGGRVIRSALTGKDDENFHLMEFSLNLKSNPEFTANVLVGFCNAVFKMYLRGDVGCKTVFDIAPIDLLPEFKKNNLANLL